MAIFNLKMTIEAKHKQFVRRYVEAMGYTHYNNRDPYRWWNYEDLLSSPDEDWKDWIVDDPSLSNLLSESKYWSDSFRHWAQKEYGVSLEVAKSLVTTYIGYHPSYGGYLCQIGPYRSVGGGHGIEHVRPEAIDKFNYYVWRRRKSSAEDVADSLSRNIDAYQKAFNVTFTTDDFALVVRPPQPYDPTRVSTDPSKKARQPRRKVVEYLDSLDPAQQATQQYFHMNPMMTEGTVITVNNRGYVKLLQKLMGPWYNTVIMELAVSTNQKPEEIAKDVKLNSDLLEEVYNKTYDKWLEAKAKGDADAMGMPPPPKFKDRSLQSTSGERYWRQSPTNDQMDKLIDLRVEILKVFQQGIISTQEIADKVNAEPKRMEVNKKRKQQGKEPILVTSDDVQRILNQCNKEREKQNVSMEIFVNQTVQGAESHEVGRGYTSLDTAFEMCSLYFSSQPLDPSTKAKLGGPNAIIFNPPKNFQNFTTEDLQKFRDAKTQSEEVQKPKEATPEQVTKDIGEALPEKTPAKEPKDIEQPEPIETEPVVEEEPSEMELLGDTFKNLIKIAEDLDREDKVYEAEEVHKIIRKYAKDIL